jgi:phospholipase C
VRAGRCSLTPTELREQVATIVVVIMENRSFDNVLGSLSHPDHGNRTDVDGIADLQKTDYLNPNSDGEGIEPFWTSDGPLPSDLPHDRAGVRTQMAHSTVTNSHLMNGFVKAFEAEFHTSVGRPPPMGLLRPTDLPTTSALAAQYTVCDEWFACVPTSTAPNRLMSMCGFTDIDETGVLVPDQQTVYDWLLAHGVPWRVYSAGLPFFMLMPRLAPLILTSHFRRLEELRDDLRNDPPSARPQVIFIEPDYYDSPIHLQDPCDNHPPLAMAPGEAFLGGVYRTLTASAGWDRTVLVVTYDEHGGFFDHVPPLPVRYRNPNGVKFDSTGPRVPAIVAGPFAPRGVSHAPLDNTSILQLLADRFGDAGEAYSKEVAARMQQGIASLASVLSAQAGNVAIAAVSDVAAPAPSVAPLPSKQPLRAAFDGAARRLVAQHGPEALVKYPELARRTPLERPVLRRSAGSEEAPMQTYTVQAGETLGRIAKRFYGDAARYPLIVSANAIADPDRLLVGQSLVIPDADTAARGVAAPAPVTSGSKRALSEQRLAKLHPGLANRGRAMLDACGQAGLAVMVSEGLRTWEEQDALYAKGRTVPPLGKKHWVTKAKGGESYHNFGLAFDIVVLDAVHKDGWDDDHPGWTAAARIGKALGLEWGGDWTSFKDRPHYQWTGGLALKDCRTLYAGGLATVWAKVPV